MGLRVFYLTTEPPYPPTSGGRVRTHSELGVLAGLDAVDSVVLQHLREEEEEPAARAAFLRRFPKVHLLEPVFHPIHLKQFPRYVPRVLGLRALGAPYLAAKWDSPALRRRLREELDRQRPDVVVVDHLGMMQYAPLVRRVVPGARLVLEQHNVESDFFAQHARARAFPKDLVFALEWLDAKRFERAMLREADAVIAISPLDAKSFQELAGVDAEVVPPVVEPPRRRDDVPEGSLLYVGNLAWHPNVAGLDWFFAKVWPLVQAARPALRLRVAGTGLPTDAEGRPVVPAHWQKPGVEVLGFVADLAPLYQSSSVALAPLFGGSGVRIKLLEAMRAGLPLVTTPEALDGTALRAAHDVAAHDEPEAFAKAIVQLVEDPAARVRQRDAAYDYVERCHTPDIAAQAYRRALGLPTSRR